MWRNFRNSKNKFNNKKVISGGYVYDSKREARRGAELELLLAAGKITDLQRQVKYVLIPAQRESDTIGPKGGVKKGKVIEKEVAYVADFVYKDETGATIVEDVKGMRTKDYILKRKMLLYFKGIRIKEV